MKTLQAGFTLIELVVVIVILGILAAVAIPKFIDLSAEAYGAALKGVQGGAASAHAINYAGCAAVNNVVTANKCAAATTCGDTGSLMVGGLPGGYTITVPAASLGAAAGDTATCTINQTATSNTKSFTGIYTTP